jgi:hypothetical protein
MIKSRALRLVEAAAAVHRAELAYILAVEEQANDVLNMEKVRQYNIAKGQLELAINNASHILSSLVPV